MTKVRGTKCRGSRDPEEMVNVKLHANSFAE